MILNEILNVIFNKILIHFIYAYSKFYYFISVFLKYLLLECIIIYNKYLPIFYYTIYTYKMLSKRLHY